MYVFILGIYYLVPWPVLWCTPNSPRNRPLDLKELDLDMKLIVSFIITRNYTSHFENSEKSQYWSSFFENFHQNALQPHPKNITFYTNFEHVCLLYIFREKKIVKLPKHKDPLSFSLNVRKANGNQFQFKNSIEDITVKHIDHNHSAYFFHYLSFSKNITKDVSTLVLIYIVCSFQCGY